MWAHCQLGRVSAEHYDMIADISDPGIVTADRVDEIEAETRHDIMALTKAMAEKAGEAAWCIHLGATSNDIVDSAVALQIRDSIKLQRQSLMTLLTTLCDLAERERDTVMLGRTHGQAAVPTADLYQVRQAQVHRSLGLPRMPNMDVFPPPPPSHAPDLSHWAAAQAMRLFECKMPFGAPPIVPVPVDPLMWGYE